MRPGNEGGPVALACARPRRNNAKTAKHNTALAAEPQSPLVAFSFSTLVVAFAGLAVVRVVDPSGADLGDLLHALADAANELDLGDREWRDLLAAAAREHERRGAA